MTTAIITDTAPLKSKRVRELLVSRVSRFICALNNTPTALAVMRAAGFDTAAEGDGWDLVRDASKALAGPASSEVTEALAEIDRVIDTTMAKARGALLHLHPKQAEYVFAGGLMPATGYAAIPAMDQFLVRLDAFETGDERKATRDADKAALVTLASRGITTEERARLRKLVDIARGVVTTAPDADLAKKEAAHEAALTALQGWFDDWTGTAKALLTRRADLIRVGLAKPRKPVKASDAGGSTGGTNAGGATGGSTGGFMPVPVVPPRGPASPPTAHAPTAPV